MWRCIRFPRNTSQSLAQIVYLLLEIFVMLWQILKTWTVSISIADKTSKYISQKHFFSLILRFAFQESVHSQLRDPDLHTSVCTRFRFSSRATSEKKVPEAIAKRRRATSRVVARQFAVMETHPHKNNETNFKIASHRVASRLWKRALSH